MIKTITFALIVINAIFFFVEPKVPGTFTIDVGHPLNVLFEFIPANAFDLPWTFVTSTFMHADLTHLFFNMFVLFMFGALLESKLGSRRFIVFYLIAGIVGNLLYMGMAYSGIFPTIGDRNPITIAGVGASGAIMGVLGVLGIIMPRIPIFVPFVPIPVPMYVGVIIFAIFNIAISFIPSSIGAGAHLGGLAVGVLYGILLKSMHERKYRGAIRISYSY